MSEQAATELRREILDKLADAREELATARIALRTLRQQEADIKVVAVTQVYDAAGGAKALGANEAEREVALLEALLHNPGYVQVRAQVLATEAAVDRAQAALDVQLDVRRLVEHEQRERLLALLERASFGGAARLTAEDIVGRW